MRKIFLLVLFTTLIFNGLHAQHGMANEGKDKPKGLKVGDKAIAFELLSDEGNMISLEEELEKGPVVLIFYRGKWCGVCNKYLSQVQDSLSMILNTGASFLAITPEKVESANETRVNTGVKFPILIDSDETVMKSYEVLFDVTKSYQNAVKVGKMTSISANNNQDEARLPIPATYVINKKGKIIFVHFDYDYHNRASVSDILKALEGI